MKQFFEKVDLRKKQDMISFLCNHPRYSTMNSWNGMSSYSNNLKIHSLGFDSETVSKLYSIVMTDDFSFMIHGLTHDFAERFNHEWQVGFNGRSGGHLVLYTGRKTPSGYKSFCKSCGQRNYRTVEETGSFCGVCKEAARVNYETTHMKIETFFASVDQDEDFYEWDMASLRDRVGIVQAFDKLCDDIVAEAKYCADNFRVEEETVYVPQGHLVLVPCEK